MSWSKMARPRSISHKLGSFLRTDRHRRALLIEATLCLLLARTALAVIPFPYLARWLGTFVPSNDPRVTRARANGRREHVTMAREVGLAVTRAARHLPFRAVCLPQAMSARVMLKRRHVPSVLHFGAAKGNDRLDAHAWLEAASVEVTGYPVPKDFAELACFA
jgi:hypothetical protein